MLMIACSGMALVLARGSHNGPRPKTEGHYGCPKVNTKAIPLQATINIFINLFINFIINFIYLLIGSKT